MSNVDPPLPAPSMTNVIFPPPGPQTLSEVLDSGWRIFNVSLLRCLPFAAIAMIAGQLPDIYSLARGQAFGVSWRGDPLTVLLATLGGVIAVYFSAVILLRQRELAQGGRPASTLRVELAQGLRRMPTLVGVTVLSLLLVAAPAAVLLLSRVAGFPPSLHRAVTIGAALLAVPALWLLPGLVMSGVVAVFTSHGVLGSLRQGIGLVRRSWWRTMLTFVLWAVLLVVLNLAAVVLLMLVLPAFGAADAGTLAAVTPVVFGALRAIGLPFLAAILLAVYGERMAHRHGLDSEPERR
jgi:hypothetical protein